MEIKTATFVISNTDYRKCPEQPLPEYAFIGRSNVGKSSLINMLTHQKDLAKTSGRPGKTQLINHFLINKEWFLVDLPGYGYAKISKGARERWQKMIENYMLHREQLTQVFVLIDSRIPPQRIDLDFINWLGENGIPVGIIFTKTDKESQRTVSANVSAFQSALRQTWDELPDMILTSSATGRGREQVLNYIEQINNNLNSDNA
ncbi:MAG: YihA family ribosome biogenesis GTP-binding protein [Bacteroidales bacterium]|nr:YihA family ribosome biogenesis GTP-binding protein [Bacteroidales bacterium]